MNTEPDPDLQQSIAGNEISRMSPEALQYELEQLKLAQNLPRGIFAGLAAAIVMAALWAVITVVTEYQIGYMAIAVGFVVGFAIRYAGKGIVKTFGVAGAALALLGCALGNLFSQIGFIAAHYETTYAAVFSSVISEPSMIMAIMVESFSLMDILFYGLAAYAGYQYSFVKISENVEIG